ncbi:MAG: Spy/CpxP family protein refolding chaperone [Rikenellaceae bacterium]
MKNLKITAAALLLTLFSVDASAQPQQRRGGAPNDKERPTAEKMAEIATDKLDQRLELSDSQESKIYKINLKYAEAAESAHEAMKAEREAAKDNKAQGEKGERPDRETMKAKQAEMKSTKRAQMLEIMDILKDEQKIDYALMMAEQPRKGGEGSRGQGQMKGRKDGGKGCPKGAPQQGGQKGGQQQRPGERSERPHGGEQPQPTNE